MVNGAKKPDRQKNPEAKKPDRISYILKLNDFFFLFGCAELIEELETDLRLEIWHTYGTCCCDEQVLRSKRNNF